MDIAIISEGVTDQIIIEAIVQGRLDNKDISLDPLQPKKDEPGGWPLVFKYCASKDFKESLPYNDGLTIIHIDCDVLKGADIPQEHFMQFNGLDVEQTFDLVKGKLVTLIGTDVFEQCKDRIVFAIAIDDIECWLLPLYFGNKPAICNKISGSIKALKPELIRNHNFYIDEKEPENYRTMAKPFRKNKTINDCYKRNNSFKLFVDSLDTAIAAYNEA